MTGISLHLLLFLITLICQINFTKRNAPFFVWSTSVLVQHLLLKWRQLKFPYVMKYPQLCTTAVGECIRQGQLYFRFTCVREREGKRYYRRRITIMMTQIGYVLRVCFVFGFLLRVLSPSLSLSHSLLHFGLFSFSCSFFVVVLLPTYKYIERTQDMSGRSSFLFHVVLFSLPQTFYATLSGFM